MFILEFKIIILYGQQIVRTALLMLLRTTKYQEYVVLLTVYQNKLNQRLIYVIQSAYLAQQCFLPISACYQKVEHLHRGRGLVLEKTAEPLLFVVQTHRVGIINASALKEKVQQHAGLIAGLVFLSFSICLSGLCCVIDNNVFMKVC